ncbi:MAG: hypothetical protein K2M91_02520, partial [Lachnospiraceae bacterium]|nr:hypothetical protein [Lachnospiraceae bacterium]
VQQLYEKKFSGKKEPIIISNRALDYYAEDIKNGVYETILIGDDTIRHGKTIFGLYDKISELLSEHIDDSTVDLCAFAACREDMPKRDCIKKENIKHYVNLGEYRVISDMVIDILPLSGQPYTSYIPNVALQKESSLYQTLTDAIKSMPECFADDTEQKKLNLYSTVWIDPETPDYAMFQSIRFYLYDDLELCTLVPMVSFMPISDESLSEYGKTLKDVINESYYEKVFSDCCELGYRTIIYVVSSLFLRQYIRKNLHYKEALPNLENLQEERMNFGEQILNQQKLNQMSIQDISEILENLKMGYRKINTDEIQQLDTSVDGLHNEVVKQIPETSPLQTEIFVKKFFSISGDWNEKIWKEATLRGDTIPKDSCDYPMIYLSNQLIRKGRSQHEFYMPLLKAIDYGRGAIVAREKKKEGKTYYLPFLTAGERNYKYKQEKYFPLLYGMLEIEQKAAKKAIDSHSPKVSFLNRYMKLEELDEKEREEVKVFCDIDITTQYQPVLLKDFWVYPNREKLDRSILLADEIMQ